MRALIDNLDEYSQTQLNSVYEQLWTYEDRPATATKRDIETMYRTLAKFLHKHYLREYGIRPWNPNPQHIGISKDEEKEQPENPEPQHIGEKE